MLLKQVNIKHLMTGPEGNKINCSPREQSVSDLLYSKKKINLQWKWQQWLSVNIYPVAVFCS